MSYSTWDDYGNSDNVQQSRNEEEKLIEIVSAQHKKKILSEWEFCIILVYGKWCGPCKVFKPKFYEYSKRNAGYAYFAIENVELGLTQGVNAVPTIAVYQRGQLIKLIKGGILEDLSPYIDQAKRKSR